MAASDSAEPKVIEAVRDAVAALDEVRLLPPPPLDLEASQLAIDCTDESTRCMGEVAERMQAEIIVVPALKKRADSLELHLKCFRTRTAKITTAMRKQAGTRLHASLLEAVPSMVHELLGSTGSSPASEPVRAPELDVDEPPAPVVQDDVEAEEPAREPGERSWLGPLVVGGGGVALVVAGVVFGAMASASEDDYASRDIDTAEQAERAHAVRETGESQATTANVLFAAGGLALAAAGVWYLLDSPSESATQTARIVPVVGPSGAGLVLTSRLPLQP